MPREAFWKDIRLTAKQRDEDKNIQGPAHTFYHLTKVLGLTLKDHKGNIIINDENDIHLDFLHSNLSHFKKMITLWIRKAIFQQLRQRASLPAGSPGARKDLADVPAYVDIHATTANFRMKKGDYKYATDHHARNSLESVIAGSIRAGDRLHAAGLIDTDKCPHCGSEAPRHTTLHMFWECSLHNKCRKKAKLKTDMLLNRAMQQHGHTAKNHLTSILDNNAFRHTSICPDDITALKQYKQNITKDAVFTACASAQHIISHDTQGAETLEINGTRYIVVYTDGSTIMP